MLPHSPPTAQPTMRPSDGPKPLSNKVPKTSQKSSPSNPWVAQTPLFENTPPVRSPPLPAAPSIFPPSRPWWPNWPPLLIPSQKPIDADTAGAATNTNRKSVEVAEEPGPTPIQLLSNYGIRKNHLKALQNSLTATSLCTTGQRSASNSKPTRGAAQRLGQATRVDRMRQGGLNFL